MDRPGRPTPARLDASSRQRGRSGCSSSTAQLVAEALRRYAVEAFTARGEMMVIEVADFRHGHGLEVAGEVADGEAARAVFDLMCRRRPDAQVTLRKRGWVLGSKRPGEEPPGGAG